MNLDGAGHPIASRLPLVGSGEAAALADAVHAHRELWSGSDKFFTLGAASYIEEPERYREHAARVREPLWASFRALYGRLADALATHLGAPVEFSQEHALPGFHIWLGAAIFTRPTASIHFDLQYERLRWDEEVDLERVVSFTLPIRLPAAGGGLNVWPVSWQQVQAFFARTGISVPLDALTVLLPRQRETYEIGELVVHSGHVLHQIGEVPSVVPGDERITLQGHGVLGPDGWLLYW